MNTDNANAEQELLGILQLAHSGELAATLAYSGHWRSLRGEERRRVREVESEELHHRELVADMLEELGAKPIRMKEWRARAIGTALGFACHISGWLAPMYGAGRLESRNIREYELAVRYALRSGRHEWLECILTMVEVAWEHESYFRDRVVSHWLGKRLRLWRKPLPKSSIRERFEVETGHTASASSTPLQQTAANGVG